MFVESEIVFGAAESLVFAEVFATVSDNASAFRPTVNSIVV